MPRRALRTLTLLVAASACSVEDRAIRLRVDAATADASAPAPCDARCACPRTFDPPADGLVAWFDSSCLAPGRAARWPDLSGAGRDAVQPTTLDQPEVFAAGINNRNALCFNGVRQHMKLPDGTLPAANGPFTVLVAASFDDIERTYNGLLAWGGIYGGHILVNPGGHMFLWWGVEARANVAGIGVPDAAPVVLAYVYNSAGRRDLGTWSLHLNGVRLVSTQAQYANIADDTDITLGRATDYWAAAGRPSNHMQGFLGEVIIYGRALGDDELASVESYLLQKWAPQAAGPR